MGRMLRLWLGEWRKNDSQYWHFLPEPTDTGMTLYMEGGESFATVESIVRGHYGVRETKPMVITYGLPDWMVVPSGHTPPLTIGSTSELLELMTSKALDGGVHFVGHHGGEECGALSFQPPVAVLHRFNILRC
ncbi:hypothetical protein Rs2_29038 [Raphanus sativus]|nr:hypothetical protein Rs2_29038 [Raphanus sativus]